MKNAYVAGPMRHIKEFNFPAFFAAEEKLVAAGWAVFNPARHDMENGFDHVGKTGEEDVSFSIRDCMNADLNWITGKADAVFALPGWEKSKGAVAEVAAAFSVGVDAFTIDGAPITELPAIKRSTSVSETIISESSTGGRKQVKLARFDLIPKYPLWTLAELYGKGQQKYPTPARNWELGYEWSKSFAAMQRHAWSFWDREDTDPEMELPHLACVAWHAFALLEYSKTHPEFDDRP